jgi:hypothetical protein
MNPQIEREPPTPAPPQKDHILRFLAKHKFHLDLFSAVCRPFLYGFSPYRML